VLIEQAAVGVQRVEDADTDAKYARAEAWHRWCSETGR